MTKLSFTLFFLAVTIFSFSQQKIEVSYDINYNFGIPVEKKGTLSIDGNKSLFIIEHKKLSSKLQKNNRGEYIRMHSFTNNDFYDMYFIDYSKERFTFKETILGKPYVVVRPIHKIKWAITNDTKKIGKFNCKKALGKFRGREYITWFTTEIPVNSGPWKLYGLPGLILEATDSLNQVQFLMKSITTKNNLQVSFTQSKGDKEISFEEYVKINKNYNKEFSKKIDSKLPREVRGSSTLSKSKGLESFDENDKE